ncbi:MAG: hypothetical protein IBJ12_05530 [Sphingomonadaceae bacterium]|nr:hypothetical protein [Sphingomonadaceae bacterium]
MTSKLKLLSASSGFALVLAFASPAYAQNTDANTLITNTVNVDFQVGGVPQTTISAQNQFRVDRKILFSVSEKTTVGTTSVTSGQQNRDVAFTLVNSSNDTLDFSLAATNTANGTTIGGGRGTDSIDVTNFEYAIDTNGNGVLDGAEAFSTSLTLNDVAKNTTVHILVRSDIPVSANGSVAVVQLAATALNSNATAITAVDDTVANTADVTSGTFQTIFAEDLTPTQGNTSRNGVSWAWDDYTVSAPVLTVFKSSRIISDGVSSTNPKAIPGAVVEYCISVANAAGAATASNVSISDLVPTNTTYVTNSIRRNVTVTNPGATQTCDNTSGSPVTDSNGDTDGGNFGTPTANTAYATLSDIVQNTASAMIFRVTIVN